MTVGPEAAGGGRRRYLGDDDRWRGRLAQVRDANQLDRRQRHLARPGLRGDRGQRDQSPDRRAAALRDCQQQGVRAVAGDRDEQEVWRDVRFLDQPRSELDTQRRPHGRVRQLGATDRGESHLGCRLKRAGRRGHERAGRQQGRASHNHRAAPVAVRLASAAWAAASAASAPPGSRSWARAKAAAARAGS